MPVKNTMAVTILLILGLFASSAFADPRIPISATAGVRVDYYEPNNVIALIGNVVKQASSTLDKEDQNTHIRTVIFAAANLPTGDEAEWHNPANKTAGRVKIVMTRPAQGGVCRVLFTQVEKSSIVRDYHEVACKTVDSPYWIFSAR